MIFGQTTLPGLPELPADTTAAKASEGWSALKAVSFDDLVNKLAMTIVDFAIHLAVAILVFYAGKFLIRKLYGLTANILYRRNVDKSLSTFILSLVNMVLYFILIVTVIGILGINTTSFIAIFASAGVAIGMALSGTLQNFAGGVLILLLKPYKVGDYIEAQGYAGVVREIQIFSTIISTPDNKSIIVPNGPLSTGSINNWSREEFRRIDWTVGISYGDDVETARNVILELLKSDERIINTDGPDSNDPQESQNSRDSQDNQTHPDSPTAPLPRKRGFFYRLTHRHQMLKERMAAESEAARQAFIVKHNHTPQVVLSELADSSVNLTVRAWVQSADYWTVFYSMNERIYNELPKHGLSFPFPQIDVHLPYSGNIAK